jgi:hypothetical protein
VALTTQASQRSQCRQLSEALTTCPTTVSSFASWPGKNNSNANNTNNCLRLAMQTAHPLPRSPEASSSYLLLTHPDLIGHLVDQPEVVTHKHHATLYDATQQQQQQQFGLKASHHNSHGHAAGPDAPVMS